MLSFPLRCSLGSWRKWDGFCFSFPLLRRSLQLTNSPMSPCSKKTSSGFPHSPEVLLMLNFRSSVILKVLGKKHFLLSIFSCPYLSSTGEQQFLSHFSCSQNIHQNHPMDKTDCWSTSILSFQFRISGMESKNLLFWEVPR